MDFNTVHIDRSGEGLSLPMGESWGGATYCGGLASGKNSLPTGEGWGGATFACATSSMNRGGLESLYFSLKFKFLVTVDVPSAVDGVH